MLSGYDGSLATWGFVRFFSRCVRHAQVGYAPDNRRRNPGDEGGGSAMTAVTRLPTPVVETWDWQLDAACRDVNTSVFFHPDNERGRARTNREERAKEVCRRCPVMSSCRAHALKAAEPYGVWGGLGEHERQVLLAR